MVAPSTTAELSGPSSDRDTLLRPLLFVLTIVTGLVDAVSYLALGHVFVANMTGNIVFLGFAVAGASGFSIPASLVALAAFLAGALVGGRLATNLGDKRTPFFAIVMLAKLALIGIALILVLAASNLDS